MKITNLILIFSVIFLAATVFADTQPVNEPEGFIANINNAKKTVNNAWWSNQGGAWFGAIGGSTLGILAGIIGILAGKAKAPRFVKTLIKIIITSGIVCLIMGVVALFMSQPYGVYYPLLLMGGITTLVLGFQYPIICKRYEFVEIRKMEAIDTVSGNK
ncbi:MAG: hypothetical protein JXD22_10995 [Sedimentisphaerales bacterium]|nr:hypothetical protein [Sedimentisphaerales bacterium]